MPEACNDGHALLCALGPPGADIPAVLSCLRGPWAVVHWQASTETLWFGRDALGKLRAQPMGIEQISLTRRACDLDGSAFQTNGWQFLLNVNWGLGTDRGPIAKTITGAAQ